MKKIIISIFCLFIITTAFAEEIYLKNGRVVYGEIVERTDDYIKVDSGLGLSITYYLDEIDSIGKKEFDMFAYNHEEAYITLYALSVELEAWQKIHKNYLKNLCELGKNNPLGAMYQYKDVEIMPFDECYDMKYSYKYEVQESTEDSYLVIAYPAPGIPSEQSGKYSFCLMEDKVIRFAENGDIIKSRIACLQSPKYEAGKDGEKRAERFVKETVDPKQEPAKIIQAKTGKEVTEENFQEGFMGLFKTDAEKTFKHFIADPIPDTVKIIKGETFSWMDFNAYIIFETNEKTFKELSEGYGIIPNDKFVGNLFEKEVMENKDIVRYYKENKLDDDRYDALYMFWDKGRGMVYFHASNAFYQRERDTLTQEQVEGLKKETKSYPAIPKTRDEKQSIQEILRNISTASEAFAAGNLGKYPQVVEELLYAKPPYIGRQYCGETIAGYTFDCEFSRSGYTIIASPVDKSAGSTIYRITTGGVLIP